MSEYYNDKYQNDEYFWGKQPSSTARIFLRKFPLHEGQTLIDIGCGEGRDSIYFARNGYQVTGFDFSAEGVRKSIAWAEELNLSVDFFQADITQYRLDHPYDVVFSSGVFHYIPKPLRKEIISNYKYFTQPGGYHALMVPVVKPFVPPNPEWDPKEQDWISGEILTHYHDWVIEFFSEEILDDIFSDYKFTVNRLIAREPSGFSG